MPAGSSGPGSATEQLFVERGTDRADIAALAQGAKPPPARGFREADLDSQLVVADPSVPLQFGQDFQINFVEGLAFRHGLLLGIIGAPACQAR